MEIKDITLSFRKLRKNQKLISKTLTAAHFFAHFMALASFYTL